MNIYVYCWTTEDDYCIKSYTTDGIYINTFPVQELHDWNNVLAVDVEDNVYTVTWNPGEYYIDSLRCYDKDGNLLYNFDSEEYDSIYAICVGPDGYIYTLEYRAVWDEVRIVKRTSGIVDVVESKAIQYDNLCQGFIMDSDKNIYMQGPEYGYKSVKYNYDDSSPLQIKAYSNTIDVYQRTLAIVNGVLAIGDKGSSEIKTAELDLSAYINESLDIATMRKPIGIGNIGNDFILCGRNTVGDYAILGRYLSDGTKVWETNIGTWADTTPYQVSTYPFANGNGIVPPTVTTQEVTNAGGEYTYRGFEYYEKGSGEYLDSMYAVREIGIFPPTITATGNGNITDIGGENATKRGICYNTTGNPTIEDSKVEEVGDFEIGAFTEILTGLSTGVTYYIKAYAYNSAGYGYGEEISFITDEIALTVITVDSTCEDRQSTTLTAVGTVNNGEFRMTLYGLKPATWYWIRAFAGNSLGLVYGEWVLCGTIGVPSYDVYTEPNTAKYRLYVSDDEAIAWRGYKGPYSGKQTLINIGDITNKTKGVKVLKIDLPDANTKGNFHICITVKQTLKG